MEGEPHFINPNISRRDELSQPEQISLFESLSTFMTEINTTKRAMVATILLGFPEGIDHNSLREELKARVEYQEDSEILNDENSFKDFLRVFSETSKIIKKKTFIKKETNALTNFYFIEPVYQTAINAYLEKFLNFSDSYQINFESFLNHSPGESVDNNNFPVKLAVAHVIYKQIEQRGFPIAITQKNIEKNCHISPGTAERILSQFQKMNLGEYQQYGSRPHIFFQLTNEGEIFAKLLKKEPKKVQEAILLILLQAREEDMSKALSYKGIIAKLKEFPQWSNLSTKEEESLSKSVKGFKLPKLIQSYDPPIIRSIEQSTSFVVSEENETSALADIITWVNRISIGEDTENETIGTDNFYQNFKAKKNIEQAGQMLFRSETGNPRAKLETEKNYMDKISNYLEGKSLPVTRKELYIQLGISEQYVSRILKHMQQQWSIVRILKGGREDYWKLPNEAEKLQIRMIRAFTESNTIFKIESNNQVTMKLSSDEGYQEIYEEFLGFNEYTLRETKERKVKDLQDPDVPVIELAYTEGKKSVNFTYLYYLITKDFFSVDSDSKRVLPSETKVLKRCYSWLNYFLRKEYFKLQEENPSLSINSPVSVEQLLEKIVQDGIYDAVSPSVPLTTSNLDEKSINGNSISILDVRLIPDLEEVAKSNPTEVVEEEAGRDTMEFIPSEIFSRNNIQIDAAIHEKPLKTITSHEPELSLENNIRDSLKMYLNEIKGIEFLTEAEERELSIKIAQGDKTAKKRIIEANLPLVVSIAKKLPNKDSMLDMIQEGNLGLEHATEKFDHRKGFRFSTYATWWIKSYIYRAFYREIYKTQLSNYQIEIIRKITKASTVIYSETGKEASIEEIASRAKLKVETVREVLDKGQGFVSYDQLIEEGVEKNILLKDNTPNIPVVNAQRNTNLKILKPKLDRLSSREREVIAMYYGLNGDELPIEQISYVLGLSEDYIKKIHRDAIKKMQQTY